MTNARKIAALTSDVLVIGAGPAGIAAAVRAGESGARVLVIDDNLTPGGQIWRGAEHAHIDSLSARWFARLRSGTVQILTGAQVIGASPSSSIVLVETATEAMEIAFSKLILATGAREIFLPFPGWTLPGVMGVGGLQALAKSGVPVSDRRIIIAGSGPLLLAVAAYLRAHGAHVRLIAEQAPRAALARFILQLCRTPGKIVQAADLRLSLRGVPYHSGCWVEAAEGNGCLERVRLRSRNRRWTEDCDYAGIAYGLYPNTELARLLGCQIDGRAIAVNEFQQSSASNIFCAGECTGIGGVDLSIVEGEIAGYAACDRKHTARSLFPKRKAARRFAESLKIAFALRDELRKLAKADTFVCRCEDVTLQRLQNIASFRSAKLHTRCGMGPCQGRVCGPATDFLFGWRTESIRPPIFPARIGSLILEETTSEETSIPQ